MSVDENTAKRQRKDDFDIVESLNVVASTSSSASGLKIVAEAFITSYIPEDAFIESNGNTTDVDSEGDVIMQEVTTVTPVIIPDDESNGEEEWIEPVEESKTEQPSSPPPQPDENGLYPQRGWDADGNLLPRELP